MNSTDAGIAALVEQFPRIFKGQQPRAWSDLPSGWNDIMVSLLVDVDAMLDDEQATRFEIVQIKEKFAGLRVYWQLGEEETMVIDIHGPGSVQRLDQEPEKPTDLFQRIRDRVRQSTDEASRTCQRCSNGGATAGGQGWITTLCRSCRAKQELEEKKG